jgi:N-glycosylase/DNA lyase
VIIRRLPDELQQLYSEQQGAIRRRLEEFANVPRSSWFYELCFCLCTPQSSAVHAMQVQRVLEQEQFFTHGHDVLHVLRDPDTYIRFHNTKHIRLHRAREQWHEIENLIQREDMPIRDLRDALADCVNGIGLKEASHYLRNIGRRNLAIIDRHLLTNLVRCNVYSEVPAISSRKNYHAVELAFEQYSNDVGIEMDELDLLFWCAQTGHILK